MSAEALGGLIGKSQGYISGVENGTRSFPTIEFVKDYVDAIAKNDWEFNRYVDEINHLPGVSLPIKKREVDESNGKNNTLLNAFRSSAPNIMEHFNKHGVSHEEYYDFPINDLNYHLMDTANKKYFRKVELDDVDREYINDFINNYLINKLKIQNKTVQKRYALDEIKKETADIYIEQTEKLIDDLLDPNKLRY